MNIPNFTGKYAYRSVIEPARVVHDLKAQGRYPTCAIPACAIVCYDPLLWPRLAQLPGRVTCDGALAGSFLLPRGGQWVLATKAAGVGSPTAAMTVEEHAALGVRNFVNLGTAGGLQPSMQVGDIVVCDRAIRDEGTSFHYLPATEYAYACPRLTAALRAAIEASDLPVRTGTSWTTDAPYRETTEEIRRYREEGVATVEMEAAALFAVGEFRHVCISAVFVVSDILSDEGWASAYRTETVADRLVTLFEIAAETIVANQGPCAETHARARAGRHGRQ